MLHHIPKNLPSLGDMLADLGRPHPYSLGHALGVDERTARRWIKQGHAPRPVMLALFWVTSWGLSTLDATAHNRAMAWRGLVHAQARELTRTQARADAMARALMTQAWPASGWVRAQDDLPGAPGPAPELHMNPHEAPAQARGHAGESA